MAADPIQARIDEIERVLYAPENYNRSVLSGDSQSTEHERCVAELAAELNSLRKRQIEEAAEKWGPLAPIGGQRLSTGYLPKPEPAEAEWSSARVDYNPIEYWASEFHWNTDE